LAEPKADCQEKSGRDPVHKIAALLSFVLWTLGFLLAFVIPPGSEWIWVPDTLLLVGFLPLLLSWRPAWPWLVFGFFNIFIGFVLQVAQFLPDTSLPGEMPKIRRHLAEYHVPLAWILVGALSVVYGLGRMIRGLIVRVLSRVK